MPHKLLVLGGSGFIGSEVCRLAAKDGHQVISVSRHGRPSHVSSEWADAVQWIEGNALEPETWRDHLNGVHAVIHCVGTIFEDADEGITFERINGDSVEIAAWEAEHAGVERFVFLSAKDTPPLISSRYLSAKRQGESALQRAQLREIILRPMYVYGPTRPVSLAVSGALQAAEKVPGLAAKVRPNHPLRVEQVAQAVLKAATDLDYEGVVTLENIPYIAGDGWEAHRSNRMPLPKLNPLLVGGAALGVLGGVLWGVLASRN